MDNKYNLPKEVIFCKECVISNQRPSSVVEFKHSLKDNKPTIFFDDDGICHACKYSKYKNNVINWNDRENELLKLLDKYRKNNGGYDVIVPGSGGKDSVYASHILKYKYGMNPLTITWAPHKFTEVGWQNFQNWSNIGGLDNILFTPNGKLHRYLTKVSFLNLLHPFQPFILGQRIIGPLFAAKYNVSLVMYGENQAEYGNNIKENEKPTMDEKFYTTDNPENIKFGGMKIDEICKETNFKYNEFDSYIPKNKSFFQDKKIKVHYLGYYLKWDPQECFFYASEHTEFQSNDQRTEGSYSKYSSIDDKIDPFHYFTTLIKFGLGRASYDASQEVRNQRITREEAVSLVRQYDTEFPSRYYNEFLEYVDIDEDKFWEVVDNFRSDHLWTKRNNSWVLKNTVWG